MSATIEKKPQVYETTFDKLEGLLERLSHQANVTPKTEIRLIVGEQRPDVKGCPTCEEYRKQGKELMPLSDEDMKVVGTAESFEDFEAQLNIFSNYSGTHL